MKLFGKKVYLLLLLLLGQAIASFSDNLDSLQVVIDHAVEDSNKVLAMSKLCNQYTYAGENIKAILTATQASELSQKIHYPAGQALALKLLGNIASNQSEYLKALEYYFQSLKIYEELKDEFGQAKLLSNIGGAYYNQLSYSKALEYYGKAKLIYKVVHKENTEAYIRASKF